MEAGGAGAVAASLSRFDLAAALCACVFGFFLAQCVIDA